MQALKNCIWIISPNTRFNLTFILSRKLLEAVAACAAPFFYATFAPILPCYARQQSRKCRLSECYEGAPLGRMWKKRKIFAAKKVIKKNELNFRARAKKHFRIGMFNEKKYHIIKYIYIFTLGFICKKDPASRSSIDNS